MMYFDDESGSSRFTLQDFEPTFKTKLSGSVREAWLESYGPTAVDLLTSATAGGTRLSAADAQRRIDESGLTLKNKPRDNQYTDKQLDVILDRQRELTIAKDIRDRTPWDFASPLRGLAMFGAGIADPVNLATAFVPWTRALSSARALQAATMSAQFGTRFGARFALGAADGGISTALLEPFYAGARDALGDDYGALDSIANIAFGAAFGGGLHTIGAGAAEGYRALTKRTQDFERFRGLSNEDVQYVQAFEREAAKMDPRDVQRVLDTFTPEMRRAAGFYEAGVRLKVDAPVETRGALASAFTPEREQALVQGFETSPNAVALTDAGFTPEEVASLVNDGLASADGVMTREQFANWMQQRVSNADGLPSEVGNLTVAERAANMGRRAQLMRDVADGIEATNPQRAAELRQTADDIQGRMSTAANRIAVASPDTREAALRGAVAQAADGRYVDVDALVQSDPLIGKMTEADVAAAAQRSLDPQNVRGADFQESALIDAENATAPKWQSLQDAEAALSEAETGLADTLKAGDQAFKYSRESRPSNQAPMTVQALTDSVRLSFGDSSDTLLARGQIQIVGTPKDIPGGPHPADVKAATAPDGTVYVVAENVSEVQARGIVLHEVGVHVGMREMLGDDLFESVLRDLDKAIERGEDWAGKARAAVPADTLPAHVREEQLAYLVQNAPELGIVKRIIAAVRAWAYRNFEFARNNLTLTEADFQAMAVAALHDVARRGERSLELAEAFSRGVGQTETKAFRDWFGDSKVVDAEGKPLVVYHGTTKDFAAFDPTKSRTTGVFFSTTPDYANIVAELDGAREGGARVIPAFVRIENPLYVKARDFSRADTRRAFEEGYDGLITLDDDGKPSQITAFRPEQIKSAIGNRGTFDPNNPDIRYSRGETPDTSTAKDELKPFDEAVKRTKALSGALRAAADKLDNDAQAVAAMQAAAPDITRAEIDDLLGQLRQQVKGLRGSARAMRSMATAEDTANALQSDAMQAADTMANNLQMAAVIEKRNAALNLAARTKASTFVNQFRDSGLDAEGFMALLVGSERLRVGSRVSIDSEAKGFRSQWLGGMTADLEAAGLFREFTSGAFDRDVFDALYRLGTEQKMDGLPAEAVKMAEIINKYQESARNTRNRFGAWIRDLKGYITRQTHDMFKIRDAGEAAWVDYVIPRLDLDKMQRLGLIDANDLRGSLARIYDDFAAGSHLKAKAGEDDMAAFGRGANLAKRESVSRALYFKDGVAAYEYNSQFGTGRLSETVVAGLDSAARSAALLKTLGTNPEAMLTRLMDEYEDSLRGDPARRAAFHGKRQAILDRLAVVDGSIFTPGNVTAAKVGSFLRSWASMAKLGGALISSVTDLAGYAAELRYGQGKNLLQGVGESVGALASRIDGTQRQVLNSLGVFHESTLGSVSARLDSPDLVGGKMAYWMNQFFKWNGLTWWTESLRDGAALSYSSYMAGHADKPFDKLPKELSRVLEQYKIDAGKWDIVRLSIIKDTEGRAYLSPDAMRTVPVAALENYIKSVGRTVNDASIQNLQDDLQQAIRVMFIDRAHHAVLEPNARVRSLMLQGTNPGTFWGEVARYVGQFKSFSVAMVQMVLGREVYGRGYDTIGDYLKRGRGDMVGLATYIALATGLGYAAMSLKDLVKGRTPRDATDPKTWIAAMVQGGGLGLYGDFLFGEYSRMGRTFTSSLAGPVLGNLDLLTDIFTRLRNGDDAAGVFFKGLLDNIPFMNLFYTRIALDYLILYKIQDSLNPGFLRRMERRIERENNQQFLFPPSQYAAFV